MLGNIAVISTAIFSLAELRNDGLSRYREASEAMDNYLKLQPKGLRAARLISADCPLC